MKILKNLTAQYVFKNGDAILSRRNRLYLYRHDADKTEHLLTLPYRRSLLNYNRFNIITRLLRAEIFHVIAKDVDHFLVFFDHRIFKIENRKIANVFTIPTCRRPINVYHDGVDTLIWGDYNRKRSDNPINIYRSDDFGLHWAVIYSFKASQIRHIHNIIYDPYRTVFYILTGDLDFESGIWQTKDFKTLEPFLIGSQMYRAVSIICMGDGLIIPSDSEFEKNYIRYYTFEDKKIREVQELNGSAMYAKEINNQYFVSTMYEPSEVNKHPYAELWHSRDGLKWNSILSLKKDFLPEHYFQYPIIQIPQYDTDYKQVHYYVFARSVKGGARTIILNKTKSL